MSHSLIAASSYVGTLHEINSESSTVALEQVKSFGTESRRTNPAEQIPGSDGIYDYIVFRGSDVKDLRIEEPPKESKPPPPQQVPNDPAILGVRLFTTRRFISSKPIPQSLMKYSGCKNISQKPRKRTPVWRSPLPSF